MKYTTFTLLKFSFAIATLLALICRPFIPPITQILHPSDIALPSIYGPADLTSWLDRKQHLWRCENRPEYTDKHCGASLSWKSMEPIAACSDAVRDRDGDGWDWENGHSCVVYRRAAATPEPRLFPRCQEAAADVDGDGWGWEQGRLCKMVDPTNHEGVATAEGSWPYCTRADSDPDGDGWGWENEQSCVVRGSSADPNLQRPKISSAQAPYCNNADSDPDGDGWGWEHNQSCVVPEGLVDQKTVTPNEIPIGIDMSRYTGLRFYLQYEGRADYVRIYLRNYNPAYTDRNFPESTKFMWATLLTSDLKAGPATLPFSHFNVAQWWLEKSDKPRAYGALELSNIVSVGLEFIEPGVHRMQLDKIELIGERVPLERLLWVLGGLWLLFLAPTLAGRYIASKYAPRPPPVASPLEAPKKPLKKPPGNALDSSYQRLKDQSPIGLLLLEVDHRESIVEHCGHEVCEEMTTQLHQLIGESLRESATQERLDIGKIAILTPRSNLAQLEKLAQHLRSKVAERTFNNELKLSITVSVGFTLVAADENFNECLKRAEWALFQAMKTRNTVCSSPRPLHREH